MNTPFGRDIFGELVVALRERGLKVGAYVCPSLWNHDLYWAPNALTSPGPVCEPNYDPNQFPDRWSSYLRTLHDMIGELADLYAPDLFWVDCMNAPPLTDTRIESLLSKIRSANEHALVMTRNGVFSDYVDLTDQSEDEAKTIMGKAAVRSGVIFEIGTVLQESRQWAFDPKSNQKPPSLMIANTMLIASKGGNYLINVAPGPSGAWPSSAYSVLTEMSQWMAVNGEAFVNTSSMYPYECVNGNCFFMLSEETNDVYVLVPSITPGAHVSVGTPGVPTGARSRDRTVRDHTLPAATYMTMRQDGTLSLPSFRTDVLRTDVRDVNVLGVTTASSPVRWEVNTTGLHMTWVNPDPMPSWSSNGMVIRVSFS